MPSIMAKVKNITPKNNIYLNYEISGEFIADPNNCNACPACASWTVESLVEGNGGNGHFDHLARLDYKYRPHKGSLEHLEYGGAIYPVPKLLDKAELGDYEGDVYILTYSNKDHAGGDEGREVFEMKHTLVVAFPTGSADGDQYVKMIETLLKVKVINSPLV